MIKKQKRTIIVCIALFAALTILYLSVIAPMLKPEQEKTDPIEVLEGEQLGSNNRVYMFPREERATVKRLEVKNEHGSFAFYKLSGKFYIEDKEIAPYDLELFSSLIVSTSSPLASKRFILEAGADLSPYGLAPSDEPASYTLTTEDKKVHKVWVGDAIPGGNGYYCMYDGRLHNGGNVIYILSASIAITVLADVYSLITPTVGMPVPQTDYSMVTKQGVIKNGVPIYETKMLTAAENGTDKTDNPVYSYEFTLEKLKNFTPDASVFTHVVQVCSALTGEEVLACGKELDEIRLKTDYGIDIKNPHFAVYYTYDGDDCTILASKPDEDGYMNVYSALYHMVVRMKSSAITFYGFNTSDYVEKRVFQLQIGLASKVDIWGVMNDNGKVLEVNSSFGLKQETKKVDGNDVTTQYLWDYGTEHYYDQDEINNFRQVYRDILYLQIGGETEEKDLSDAKHICTVSVTDTDGKTSVMKFYAYSSTRCYITVNDEANKSDTGMFFTTRAAVEKLIRDLDGFNRGLTVNELT